MRNSNITAVIPELMDKEQLILLVKEQNKIISFQNDQRDNRAAELVIANKELAFQNDEKKKRKDESILQSENIKFLNLVDANSKKNLHLLNQAQAIANYGHIEYNYLSGVLSISDNMNRIFGLIPGNNILSIAELLSLIHPDDLEYFYKVTPVNVADHKDIQFECRIIRKGGEIRHLSTIRRIIYDNNNVPIGNYEVVRDITDQKKIEQILKKQNQLYLFNSKLNQAITHCNNSISLFEAICHIAVDSGEFKIAAIGSFSDEGSFLNYAASANTYIEDIHLFKCIEFIENGAMWNIKQHGKYFIINDIENELLPEKWKQWARLRNWKSYIALPIKKADKVVAVFNLWSNELSYFDKDRIKLLEEACFDVSFTLERLELETKSAIFDSPKEIIMFSLDINYCYLAFTGVHKETMKQIWGCNIEVKANMLDLITSKNDKQKAKINFDRALNGEYFSVEEDYGNTAFSRIFYTNNYSPIYDKERKIIGVSVFVMDSTKVRNFEKKSIQFAQAIEQSYASIAISDTDGNIEYVNPSFIQKTGYTSAEVIGKNHRILKSGYTSDIEYKELWQRITSGKEWQGEFHNKKKNGELYWEYTFISPIKDAQGNIINFLAIKEDITERKLEEKIKKKIIDDIIQRNKDLEQFSYIISHNLRAPVANIMGISQILQKVALGKNEERKFLEDLTISVEKLDTVIRDINIVLQVRSQLNEKKEIINFSNIVTNINTSIGDLIKTTNVKLITDFSSVDEMFSLKSYLYSIFYNLILNSIKYRRNDINPVIEITSRKTENTIELIFKDNGIGIDMTKNKELVFGLYKRFHEHTEGKGVGLFMVKTQVESLGGKIFIESEINIGTEFRIVFECINN